MTTNLRIIAAAVLVAFQVHAHAQQARPAFDSASVKAAASRGRASQSVTPDGVAFTNVTLAEALAAAHGLKTYQVFGPAWLTRDRFDITARSAGPADRDQTMRMLQALLAERFHLSAHRETRSLPAYVLRVGKGTPKLTPAEARGGITPAANGTRMEGVTMAELADQFFLHMPSMDRPVIDRTGLTGRYTITLTLLPAGQPATHDELKEAVLGGGPELFIHALEAVGLVLARETVPLDALVVDTAGKVPSAN